MKKTIFAGILLCLIPVFGFGQIDNWKNNWLIIGGRLGGDMGGYAPGKHLNDLGFRTAESDFNFTGGVHLGLQLARFFAIQTEFQFSGDNPVFENSRDGTLEFKMDYMTIPVMARFTFNPGRMVLGPFIGGYCTVPLGETKAAQSKNTDFFTGKDKMEAKTPVGFLIGLDLGGKVGPGALFFDMRFLFDFDFVKIDNADLYYRVKMPLTIGYEMYLITKR